MVEEAEIFYKQGVQAILTGDYDIAEYLLLKSFEIEVNETNSACLGWLYGTALSQEEKALRFFYRAILKNNKNGDLYNDFGALLLKTGRFKESVKWFLRAIRLGGPKKKHYALYNLALVYRHWERPERSIRYLRLALEYKPDFREAHSLYYSILDDKNYGDLANQLS